MTDPLFYTVPPADFDPDAEKQTSSRQRQRADLLQSFIDKNTPQGYFVKYTWNDDPLEYLRVEFENVSTHKKSHTDVTFETLLKQSTRYLGQHVIKQLVDADEGRPQPQPQP